MVDRATGSLTLEIEVSCEDQEADENYCYAELVEDSEYNLGKTCYAPGDYAYFRVYKNGSFEIKSTVGTPTLVDSNVGEVIVDESIVFSNFVGTSERPISSVRSARWVGTGIGHVHYVLDTNKVYVIENSSSGFGVLRITYESRFNRYKTKSNEVGDLVAYALGSGVCNGTSAYVVFTYSDDCLTGAKPVTIVAHDAITGESVPNATVTIDGIFRGFTNTDGQLFIGYLTIGTHTIRIVAAGYQDTVGDGLANDDFEVTD